ncbi:hypothetical protein QJQ45_028940 [Haematococcus lacustris]|nr:hypothetical protein QJQ45_028940 [Haematococcus lacustris]
MRHKRGPVLPDEAQVPLLLTPDAKSRILQGEATVQEAARRAEQCHHRHDAGKVDMGGAGGGPSGGGRAGAKGRGKGRGCAGPGQGPAGAVQGGRLAFFAGRQGVHPVMVAYLDIHVRRDHILHDALEQIIRRPQCEGVWDLKGAISTTVIIINISSSTITITIIVIINIININISNSNSSSGSGAGCSGWLRLSALVLEIFREDYGMFVWNDESRTFWLNPCRQVRVRIRGERVRDLESELEFQLVGVVMGLAIYNGIILDVKLPLVAYKVKLLGEAAAPSDLAEVNPGLARGLQQLLDFEGDVEATFCRTFEVEYDFFGDMRKVELLPGGAQTPVTAANRPQYVQLYCDWLLTKSIAKQFTAFAHGFHQVCGGLALGLFTAAELELLVAGLPHLDFEAMRQAARVGPGNALSLSHAKPPSLPARRSGSGYEGGYHAEHPTILDFWSILQELNTDQKCRFLAFTTGCDRAPVGGLGQLRLTVQRSGPDTPRLPSAHTCFNVLLLPEYDSKAKMRDKLLTAIENAQGFGLQ